LVTVKDKVIQRWRFSTSWP